MFIECISFHNHTDLFFSRISIRTLISHCSARGVYPGIGLLNGSSPNIAADQLMHKQGGLHFSFHFCSSSSSSLSSLPPELSRCFLLFFRFVFCSSLISLVICTFSYVDGELTASDSRRPNDTPVRSGDTIAMELNLNSEQPENRTLTFFVNHRQQKYYINHLPPSVVFVVWFLLAHSPCILFDYPLYTIDWSI